MNKIIFIADFFADEVPGGGELNNQQLIEILRKRGVDVLEIKSQKHYLYICFLLCVGHLLVFCYFSKDRD